MLEKAPRTSTEDIRRQLAERIISSELPPGTVLDETQLASEFCVSRTPVREALKQLAASGLVDQRPHTRTVVAKPDEKKLAGMFELMGHLEALCAGLSASRMSPQERDALDTLHGEMALIVSAGDRQAYITANERFHAAIYRGSQNPYLEEITLSTRQRLQPFRRAQFSTLGRLAKSHAEHGMILEAILRGNQTEAERMMHTHITLVEDAYRRIGHAADDQATRV
ncbi:GntR family transcriptional regulator [Rhizobium oryzicola]|uniref:GntR family transcriptional regulator n=1 Tax=Rhizobium oryzicola TaxID=1232668 RepID=A0ABT8T3N2_9HYPH|nr:GntR family transcriptional regulator [Rhizobium oryzicola]MDO1584913.1 GntR family transcriptional regulator [Rhizobium oryzicola]